MNVERRYTSGKVELRSVEGAPSKVTGYAALFNARSATLRSQRGPFVEVIEPGAFDEVLNDDVRALFNHDQNLILARSNGGKGTLRLWIDDSGLGYEFEAPDTTYARDLVASMQRGDVDASSFAFELKQGGDQWEQRDGVLVRTIKRGGVSRLHDVSPVTYPAYPDTQVSVRSLDEFLTAQERANESTNPSALSLWERRLGFLIK